VIRFVPVTGGLTNILTKASIPAEHAKEGGHYQVLVRFFGNETDKFFDRNLEDFIYNSCSREGLAPGYVGAFPGGRIEEFIDAETLTVDKCKFYLKEIGEKIAEIHQHYIEDISQEPCIFNRIEDWFKHASEAQFGETKTKEKALYSTLNFDLIKQEIDYLKSIIIPLNSPVVFCHNDLCCGNIMRNPANNKLYIIDYEYANYNYRGYDISNHFDEWTTDYTRSDYPHYHLFTDKYPTEAQREVFLRSYIHRTGQLKKETYSPEQVTTQLQQLQKEIDYFLLLPHFGWSLWAVTQAAHSDIEFGYMEYALDRLNHYYDLKKLLIQKYNLNSQ